MNAELFAGIVCVAATLCALIWGIYKLATMPGAKRIDVMDARIRDLAHRVATLERRIEERPGAASTPAAPATKAAAAPVAAPSPASAHAPTPTTDRPAPPSPPSPELKPVSARVLATETPKSDASLETFVGGRVMLIAGVIVALFGIAFFLKFAIDKGWVGPAARVATGVATGLALLVGGFVLRRRGFDVFGQALMGCGLGALYLSNYFACTRYGFVSESGAFILAAAVTALGAELAVLQSAPVLAYLGFLGGWMAPALLAKPTGELGGVTAWLAVVDVGAFAVLLLRAWRGIELTALAASAFYFFAWRESPHVQVDVARDPWLLAALVAAPLACSLAPSIVRRARPDVVALVAAAGAGAFGVLAGHDLLFPAHRWPLGAAVLALGASYLLASRLVASRVADARGESSALLGFAAAALAASAAVAFSGTAVSPVLSAMGVALVFAGTRTRQGVLTACGIATVGLAFGDLLANRLGLFDAAATPFLSERFLVFACPCAALLVCGVLMERAGSAPSAVVGGFGLWVLPFVIAFDVMAGADVWRDERFETRVAAATAVLAVYGALSARFFRPRDGFGRFLAFGPIAIALFFGLWLVVDGHRTPFTPLASAAFVAGLALVGAAMFAASTAESGGGETLRVTALVYLVVLVAGELHAWGERRPLVGITRKEAEFVATVWTSIAWALYASALVGVGFWRRRAALRWTGLAVFALTLGKVFLVDMAEVEAVYRIASFLVLGVLLVGASFLYQRARRGDATPTS